MNATAQTGIRSDKVQSSNNIPPVVTMDTGSSIPDSFDANSGDLNPDYYRVVSQITEGDRTLIVEVHEIRDVGTLQRDILISADASTMQVTWLQGLRPIFVEDGTMEYLRCGVMAMGETQSRLR